MNTYRIMNKAAIAACVVAFYACTAENALGPLELPGQAIEEGLVEKSFTATLAEGHFGVLREKQQVAVFDGTAKRVFTVESVTDGKALLRGAVAEDSEEYHVVYPYASALDMVAENGVPEIEIPAIQTIAEGDSLSVKASVSYGKADEQGNVVLESRVSYIKIAVPEGVPAVKIQGKYYENLVDGKETIVLTPAGDTFEAGNYYVAVLPVELPEGYRVVFDKDTQVAVSEVAGPVTLVEGGVEEVGTAEPVWVSTIIVNEEQLRSYFADQDSYAGMEMKLGADIELTTKPWTPVELKGHFNGQGHTISGLEVNTTAHVGFFSKVHKGATAEDFTIEGTIHAAAPAGAVRNYVGVAGIVAGGTLSGVVNKAVITTDAAGKYSLQVGGLAGALTSGGKIAGCENYGNITLNGTADGISVAGGIVGYVGSTSNNSNEPGGLITGCRNHAVVTSSNNKVEGLGGVVGMLRGGEIISCQNVKTAKVAATLTNSNCNVAGVCGYLQNRSGRKIRIANCVNEGEILITTGAAAGGIVGGLHLWHNAGADIQSCRNTSDISVQDAGANANFYLGGIVGRFAVPGSPGTATNTISDCVNSGNLTSTRLKGGWLGGIVGNVAVNTIVSGCENSGNLSLTASETAKSVCHVGGIVGEGAGVLTVADNVNKAASLRLACYSESAPAKTSEVGGIIGRSFSLSTITSNVNHADLSAEYNGTYVPVGGIVGCVQNNLIMDDNTNFGDAVATSKNNSTSMDSFAGGLVGQFALGGDTNNYGSVSLTSNKTFGYVSSSGRAGLLFGAAAYNCYASIFIRKSVVGGYVKGTVNSGAEVTHAEKLEISSKNFSENLWSYRKDTVTQLKIENTTFGRAEDYK